ncbi:uncharacterized protein LOC122947121 [Acropora millepora]|uniref:uncharacterized protein LOC122947121 n=1 Tax=Acropora millepora TaxID=45264 RepID=UPI001CF4D0B2|nr:uncharacterized protein LOC122947121 [Acropora millepora]
MQVTQFLVAYILHNLKTTQANCQTRCEQTNRPTTDTRLANRALVGHSFKNFTVNKPYDCHLLCFVEKCRCQAYQMKGKHSCELLDEDRFAAPTDFVEEQGYEYYDMSREYEEEETNNACANQPCNNKCCEDNPCSNGGTCTELCQHAKQKFNCTCAIGYGGKFCEKNTPIPQSCKQLQLEAKNSIQSDVYSLYDPTTKTLYQTFCDFTSETGFVWTLLESFSFPNKNDFAKQQFYKDYAVNQNSFKWNKFRLSLPIMNSTLSHSTHFRATCNFNTNGLVTTDYLRAKTTDLNILQLNSGPCVKMEYINIRGYDCYDCTALMSQTINWHLHTDSSSQSCQFKSASNGSVKSGGGEDNFGYYGTINPLHRCTSGDNATTQWWFGEQ